MGTGRGGGASGPAQGRGWFPAFWLSLAIILVHALAPTAAPWRESHGSAFNGFTRDVSLGPSRTSPVEKSQRIRDRRHQQTAPEAMHFVAAHALAPAAAILRPIPRDQAFSLAAVTTPERPFTYRRRARSPPIA